ncbi:hypothetical protein [Alicyclobacillus fastidiosus]|uniref:Uncharacterized protein n=1 Tax=Alicyclobacillus fastidiosus TaxID=392011 RepID=A0ABV5AL29_9BACL|nr:hypothetical protein [Alicyclobacillus fastidiosus]WEH08465.1 hypothetical protein PYS47_17480 [Alicyclobacillus fastidiosus]
MKNLLSKADNAIMSGLVWATTTKQAFYALNLLVIAAVLANPPTSIQGWLLVIVSEYYQGVALPGLGAAQKKVEEATKKENEQTRKLLQETHDAVMDELAEIRSMHEAQVDELAELKEVHQDLLLKYERLARAIEALVGESLV